MPKRNLSIHQLTLNLLHGRLSRNAFRTTFMLLMLVFGVVTVTAQSLKSIKGVVVDKENNSVIGASVLQKGTNNGVVTDLDGNFTLTMQDDAPKVIIISYLGMKSQEISVTKANLGQITLVEDAEMLDEVVVVSYGKQSKRLITGLGAICKSNRTGQICR